MVHYPSRFAWVVLLRFGRQPFGLQPGDLPNLDQSGNSCSCCWELGLPFSHLRVADEIRGSLNVLFRTPITFFLRWITATNTLSVTIKNHGDEASISAIMCTSFLIPFIRTLFEDPDRGDQCLEEEANHFIPLLNLSSTNRRDSCLCVVHELFGCDYGLRVAGPDVRNFG